MKKNRLEGPAPTPREGHTQEELRAVDPSALASSNEVAASFLGESALTECDECAGASCARYCKASQQRRNALEVFNREQASLGSVQTVAEKTKPSKPPKRPAQYGFNSQKEAERVARMFRQL